MYCAFAPEEWDFIVLYTGHPVYICFRHKFGFLFHGDFLFRERYNAMCSLDGGGFVFFVVTVVSLGLSSSAASSANRLPSNLAALLLLACCWGGVVVWAEFSFFHLYVAIQSRLNIGACFIDCVVFVTANSGTCGMLLNNRRFCIWLFSGRSGF